MKRLTILGTSVLLLGGCALPIPIQVASWALDGISYLVTEKSVADHGLSMLAQKDCAVLRGLLDDGEICRDNDDATTLLADRGPGNGFTMTDETEGLAALGDVEQLANFETAAGEPAAREEGAATNARPVAGQGADDGADLGDGNGVNLSATRVSLSLDGFAGEPLKGYPLYIGGGDISPFTGLGALPRETAAVTMGGLESPVPLANFETAAPVFFEGGPDAAPVFFEGGPIENDLAENNLAENDQNDQAGGALASVVPAQSTETGRIETGRTETGFTETGFTETVGDLAAMGDEPAAGLYFVIGSFRKHDNARKLRSRYRTLTPSVLAAKLERGTVFRVVVGPFVDTEAKRVHMAIFQAGISDSWAIRVKPGEWSMARVDPPAPSPVVAWKVPEKPETTVLEFIQQLAQLRF